MDNSLVEHKLNPNPNSNLNPHPNPDPTTGTEGKLLHPHPTGRGGRKRRAIAEDNGCCCKEFNGK